MLIVIAIVGTLATMVLFAVGGKVKRARDATRRNDISEIRVALEQYLAENGVLPTPFPFANQQMVGVNGQAYLRVVHQDPIGRDPYLYTYWATPAGSPVSYTVCANRLEGDAGSYCLSTLQN